MSPEQRRRAILYVASLVADDTDNVFIIPTVASEIKIERVDRDSTRRESYTIKLRVWDPR